jgi:toxin CptA
MPEPDNTLRLRPRPSALLAAVVLLMHGAVLLVIQPLPLAPWGKLLLAGAVILGLAHNLARHVLMLTPAAIVSAVWEADGTWVLTRRDGRELRAELLPSTLAHPRLVVLNFRTGASWQRTSLVLFNDALEADTLRRLRVRLRRGG